MRRQLTAVRTRSDARALAAVQSTGNFDRSPQTGVRLALGPSGARPTRGLVYSGERLRARNPGRSRDRHPSKPPRSREMELSHRPRVVIVDDHNKFRQTARDCLEAHGYDVVSEASCAASAMRAVEVHAPDA